MFSEKIKKYREELKLTQEEFSKKVDISRATLGHLESGLRNPSKEVLLKLSAASDKSIDWWFDKADSISYQELNDLNLLIDYMIDRGLIKDDCSMVQKDRDYLNKMMDEEIRKKLQKKRTLI